MKILLIISSFNSLSQGVFCKLRDLNYKVKIRYSISNEYLIKECEEIKPDLIFCPFLKEFLSKEIYEKYNTFVLHPGPLGDRGHNSLDFALYKNYKTWGLVILKANELLDGGDIYAKAEFSLQNKTKASLYRNEVLKATLSILDKFLTNVQNENFLATRQILNPIHETISQEKRLINWQKDSSAEIIKKINLSDSYPGVKDEILGIKCFLYGAKKEKSLKGEIKEILAKRDGAICLGTLDGSIWISHIKKENSFKLPATYVLKDKLIGIKENRLPLLYEKNEETYWEIKLNKKDEVAYLYFNFYNGAMSSSQAIQLKYAIEYLKEECKVLVLMGGEDFFSNGIHLNILEDSKKQGEDAWSNINAINDVVKEVLFAEDIITVSSLHKNAGAGGVFLALACDFILANEYTILNPHYKSLGLSGSEYHTYTLSKRVGQIKAKELLESCLPISANSAKQINMIDKILANENYFDSLNKYCKALIKDEIKYEEFIYNKKDKLFENESLIEKCKEKELEIMYDEFWKEDSCFHTKRKAFVLKQKEKNTPKRLKDL